MAMKKFNLFTNDNSDSSSTIKSKDATQPIIDVDLMSYIIQEFPQVSDEIKTSLESLRNTLEKSIDYIEDRSAVIVKETRNFDLSGKYREASLELHSLGNNLSDYIQWINTTKAAPEIMEDTTPASEIAYVDDSDITNN